MSTAYLKTGGLAGVSEIRQMAGDRLALQYRHALRDLTFNSKPIINNLTMLAHENVAYASTVVQVLIDHFLTVPCPFIYLS
jgi:pre-mRNA cleavage complex 2 protein Pcf11